MIKKNIIDKLELNILNNLNLINNIKFNLKNKNKSLN